MSALALATPKANPLLLDALQRCERAFKSGRVDEIRAWVAVDALVETVASRGRAIGPDETVYALRTVRRRDPYYLVGTCQYEVITPATVLTAMPVRERSDAGGIRHHTVYRLTTGRDGVVWRQRLLRTREEALACFAEHGPGLGL